MNKKVEENKKKIDIKKEDKVDSKAVTPEIIFHIMEGKDAEEIFRGRMSNYQKIAIGTLVVLAVSCLIALFLFVGAFGTGG